MKKLFNSIVSTFVEIEEKPQQPVVATVNDNPIINQQPTFISNNSVDESKFLNHFDELFEKANLPGPDYFEWQKMLQSLVNNLPESVAYVASFEALKSMGLDKQKLVESAQKYIDIIEQDKAGFGKELLIKANVEVDSRNKEIETLKNSIQEKTELIIKLNKEIEEMNVRIQTLTKESFEYKQKIENANSGYLQVAEKRKSLIQSHIVNINNIIK